MSVTRQQPVPKTWDTSRPCSSYLIKISLPAPWTPSIERAIFRVRPTTGLRRRAATFGLISSRVELADDLSMTEGENPARASPDPGYNSFARPPPAGDSDGLETAGGVFGMAGTELWGRPRARADVGPARTRGQRTQVPTIRG